MASSVKIRVGRLGGVPFREIKGVLGTSEHSRNTEGDKGKRGFPL